MGSGSFGSRLRAARRSARLSQVELGCLVGEEQSYISKLERDIIVRPHPELVMKLSQATGTTPQWLVHGVTRPVSDEALAVAQWYDSLPEQARAVVRALQDAMPGGAREEDPE